MQLSVFILLQVSLIWRSRQSRTLVFDEEVVNITRKFINLRYQLLPYLYNVLAIYRTGLPMLKPLVYFDQDDIQHITETMNIFGNQILVCPILEPNSL
jgi:alpha-glucosidase